MTMRETATDGSLEFLDGARGILCNRINRRAFRSLRVMLDLYTRRVRLPMRESATQNGQRSRGQHITRVFQFLALSNLAEGCQDPHNLPCQRNATRIGRVRM